MLCTARNRSNSSLKLLLMTYIHAKFMRWRGTTGNENKETKFAGDNKNKSARYHAS